MIFTRTFSPVWLVAAGLAVLGAAPVTASHLATPVPSVGVETEAPLAPAFARTGHLVVISIDGLRPDAIEKFDAPTLQRLMREGTYTLEAQTILPSKTLPSHTSMLTGVGPAVHGITWNGDLTLLRGTVRVPTVFSVARSAGLRTAAFFSKSKFHHLEVPGSLTHVESPRGWKGRWTAERTVGEVERDLPRERPHLTFVHFGEPDYAGHAHGWMTPAYAEGVRAADAAVARVLATADRTFGEGSYTVIVTSDHGGDGHGHGDDTPEHRTIPWIAAGKGILPGVVLPAGVKTVDTAATALWVLGIGTPERWEGRAVAGALAPFPTFAPS